jgi:hypothetical protein
MAGINSDKVSKLGEGNGEVGSWEVSDLRCGWGRRVLVRLQLNHQHHPFGRAGGNLHCEWLAGSSDDNSSSNRGTLSICGILFRVVLLHTHTEPVLCLSRTRRSGIRRRWKSLKELRR